MIYGSTSGTGVCEAKDSSTTATGGLSPGSAYNSRGFVNINTNFNSGGGWTGRTSYDGSNGQASKPATIACMWILRFI